MSIEPIPLVQGEEEGIVRIVRVEDEHSAKIEKKLEHDAAAANRLPETEQLAKFEKKLEHDDSGNQPS